MIMLSPLYIQLMLPYWVLSIILVNLITYTIEKVQNVMTISYKYLIDELKYNTVKQSELLRLSFLYSEKSYF